MKNIFIILFLLFLGSVANSQPIVQRAGPANTVSDARLKPQYNFIVPVYADTATANLTVNIGIDSCYAVIATRDSNYLWYRQCSPKKWVKLGSGGSGGGVSGNIYTIDGSLLGDRTATLSSYYLAFNRSGVKQLSLETGVSRISSPDNGEYLELYNDSILLVGGNQIFQIKGDTGSFSKRVSYTSNLGSTFTRHTLIDKNYADSLKNIIPTLQQVLTSGSDLSTSHVIDAGTNDFEMFNANSIELNSDIRTQISADQNVFQLVPDSTTSSRKIVYTGNINGTLTTPNSLITRSLGDSLYGNGGSGSSSNINSFADLTTSIVDEEGFYNGFPWPIMRGDTIIIYLKHSTEHANAGTMRIYKSFNGGRTWNTTGNVTVDGVEIQCTSIQNGIFNDTIHIAYTKDADYDTLFYAKGTSGGVDFYGAGYVTYQTGWVGSPSIQSMFTLVSDTIFSPQYEIDTDSSKAFLNYYTGGVWRRGTTVLTQTNAAFPEGRTSEWYAVVTEQGAMDANTKLAMLFRREDGSYYLFASTSNGFTTVTRDNTNLFYEMGNQGAAAPIMMINIQGIIYIVCGNRRINSTYAIEYVTSPAASFFTNTQSSYSKVRKLYSSTAWTKAAAIDFGYPLPYEYNGKPYIAFYDVSPVYHSSGEGSDDDVRSISFPLLDRGYSEKYNDANQSITDSTQTLVSYPDLLLDCMGSWDWDGDANTTDSVWEAKEDGWYMINAIATFEANGTGSYRQMYVIVVDPGVNTTATNKMISKTTIPGNSSISDFNRLECNGMAYIKQGEQVKVYVKHDATSALNLLNTSRETMATVKITLVR